MNQKEGELAMDEYLAHHGIKGQKWGIEHGPPYPVRRGSGGKPKVTTVVKSKLKAAVAKGKEVAAEKKVETAAARHAKLRDEVVSDPRKIVKYKDMFSRDELDEMIKNIEFNRRLEDVRDAEIKRGLERYKRTQELISTTANLATSAKSVYNIAAEVNNAFVDSKKIKGKRWAKIGEKVDEDRSKIEKLIRTGTPKQIKNNIDKMTASELKNALKRLNAERTLDDLIAGKNVKIDDED